jgi:DNA repair exonuclease SbcCD ATPase subunit
MLTLEKIGMKNFLSVGNVFTRYDLCKHKTTLISGKNGAGKSTLIDALCFALYGKAFRNINKPTLVNMVNKKDCVVELNFSVGDIQFKVIRGMKPTVFEIYRDGNLIDQDAASKDYQEKLEREILQISFNTFCQIVVLGAANWKAFLSLTAPERRKVLEDMLNIEIFGVMSTILRDIQTETKADLTDVDNRISIINRSIEMQDKHNESLASKAATIVADNKAKIDNAKESLLAAEQKREYLQTKIAEIQEKCKYIEVLEDEIAEYNKKDAQIEVALSRINENIQFYDNNSACPTCRQDMDDEFAKLMVGQEKTRRTKFTEAQSKIDNKLIELGEKLHKYKRLLFAINKMNGQLSDALIEISGYNSTIQWCQDVIEKATEEKKPADTHNYHKELEEAVRAKLSIVERKNLEVEANKLLKDDGIKGQIIRQYIPIINTLVNRYLERMEFFVKFQLNEKFEMEIKALHKEDMSYESFSQGEKMRIDLAILFAWRDIIRQKKVTHCNLLILDEIMDSSLDVQGTDDFLEIIRQLTKDNNVFIISHKQDQISDKFDNIIEIEKKKNFSRMKRA